MSSFNQKVDAVIDAIPGRTLPGLAKNLAFAGIAWGVIGLLYGLFATDHPEWTLGAVLVALFYGLCLAQGGVMFAVVMTGTLARWGRPLKRIAEGFGAFLPVIYILLLAFLGLGGVQIYEWAPHNLVTPDGSGVALAPHAAGAAHAKEWLMTPGFFWVRHAIYIGLLLAMDYFYVRNSLRPDLIQAKQRLGDKAPKWWNRIIGNGGDLNAAVEKSVRNEQLLLPVMGLGYAIIFSCISFDLIMSLDVWWFSNMFGGWLFMSSLWMGMAMIAFITMSGFDWLGLDGWVKKSTTHDLGKLMLAGCMFWAYTLYAQILPIWYTDVPEETNFLLVRMYLPTWGWLAKVVAVTCFIAPFTILLSRGVKKMRWPFAAVAVLILVGLFLERSLLVMPSAYRGEEFLALEFLLINVGLFAAVLGMFTLVFGRFIASTPVVPIADPYLKDDPWEHHVHSLDDAHAHH